MDKGDIESAYKKALAYLVSLKKYYVHVQNNYLSKKYRKTSSQQQT